jgi:hypothetical protein
LSAVLVPCAFGRCQVQHTPDFNAKSITPRISLVLQTLWLLRALALLPATVLLSRFVPKGMPIGFSVTVARCHSFFFFAVIS